MTRRSLVRDRKPLRCAQSGDFGDETHAEPRFEYDQESHLVVVEVAHAVLWAGIGL
jgi:hypothetical protein